ncbi:MAG: amidohydrolase family protein [Acidobacteriota bacterium]
MRLRAASILTCLATITALVCGGCNALGKPDDPAFVHRPEALLITDVTLISPELPEPLADAWVGVQGDRITHVGTGEPPAETRDWERLSGQGGYLIPGLIDAHVHLGSVPGMSWDLAQKNEKLAASYFAQLPRSYLYYGFTTLVDLAPQAPAELDEIRRQVPAPEILSCGRPAPIANGYPMVFVPEKFRFRAYGNFLFDPTQAAAIPKSISPWDHTPEAVAQRALADGGICLKTFVEDGFGPAKIWPVPSLGLLRELGQASAAAGLLLAVHANSLDAYTAALDSGAVADGAGVLVHGLWTWDRAQPQDDGQTLPPALSEIVTRLVDSRTLVMPTLQVLAGDRALFDPEFLNDPELGNVVPPELLAWYRSEAGGWFARQMLSDLPPELATSEGAYELNSRALARGERVAQALIERGGRVIFGSDTPSGPSYGNLPGYNGFLELQRLAAIGMPLDRLLAAATLDSARALGLANRLGSVEVGKSANLLLLRSDPLASPLAYGELETVILRGAIIERAALAAHR